MKDKPSPGHTDVGASLQHGTVAIGTERVGRQHQDTSTSATPGSTNTNVVPQLHPDLSDNKSVPKLVLPARLAATDSEGSDKKPAATVFTPADRDFGAKNTASGSPAAHTMSASRENGATSPFDALYQTAHPSVRSRVGTEKQHPHKGAFLSTEDEESSKLRGTGDRSSSSSTDSYPSKCIAQSLYSPLYRPVANSAYRAKTTAESHKVCASKSTNGKHSGRNTNNEKEAILVEKLAVALSTPSSPGIQIVGRDGTAYATGDHAEHVDGTKEEAQSSNPYTASLFRLVGRNNTAVPTTDLGDGKLYVEGTEPNFQDEEHLNEAIVGGGGSSGGRMGPPMDCAFAERDGGIPVVTVSETEDSNSEADPEPVSAQRAFLCFKTTSSGTPRYGRILTLAALCLVIIAGATTGIILVVQQGHLRGWDGIVGPGNSDATAGGGIGNDDNDDEWKSQVDLHTVMLRLQTSLAEKLGDGSAFLDAASPQSQALDWLIHTRHYQGNWWQTPGAESSFVGLDTYEMDQFIQRYALFVLAFSCGLYDWTFQFLSWQDASDLHECDWEGIACVGNNIVVDIVLKNLGLTGSLPNEIGYLTNIGMLLLLLRCLSFIVHCRINVCSFKILMNAFGEPMVMPYAVLCIPTHQPRKN